MAEISIANSITSQLVGAGGAALPSPWDISGLFWRLDTSLAGTCKDSGGSDCSDEEDIEDLVSVGSEAETYGFISGTRAKFMTEVTGADVPGLVGPQLVGPALRTVAGDSLYQSVSNSSAWQQDFGGGQAATYAFLVLTNGDGSNLERASLLNRFDGGTSGFELALQDSIEGSPGVDHYLQLGKGANFQGARSKGDHVEFEWASLLITHPGDGVAANMSIYVNKSLITKATFTGGTLGNTAVTASTSLFERGTLDGPLIFALGGGWDHEFDADERTIYNNYITAVRGI